VCVSVKIGMSAVAFSGLPTLRWCFQRLTPGEVEVTLLPHPAGFDPVIKLISAMQQGPRVYFKGWGTSHGSEQLQIPLFGIVHGQRLLMLRVIDLERI
jgi:hypothetical protein